MGGSGKRVGLQPPGTSTLQVRWESATPVRAAELKAGETGAPAWEGNYYAIAVYDVYGLTTRDQKNLPAELKQFTLLKRDGKKDLKPDRVEIDMFGRDLARVIYLFPRSAEITRDDRRVQFVAQIGRLYLAQVFVLDEMVYQNKLEL